MSFLEHIDTGKSVAVFMVLFLPIIFLTNITLDYFAVGDEVIRFRSGETKIRLLEKHIFPMQSAYTVEKKKDEVIGN